MPNEERSFQLYAVGKTHENRSELTNLSAQLEAVLVDQGGGVVCHGTGVVPKEGGLAKAAKFGQIKKSRLESKENGCSCPAGTIPIIT